MRTFAHSSSLSIAPQESQQGIRRLDPKFSACRKRTPEDFEELNRKIAAWIKAHPVQMWLVCIGIVLGALEVALILKLFVEWLGRKAQ